MAVAWTWERARRRRARPSHEVTVSGCSPARALQGVVEAGAVLEPAVHARGTVGQELHLAEGTRPEGSRGAAEVRPRCGRGAAEVRPRNADGCANGTSEVAASDGAAGGVTSETAAPRLSGVRMSEQDVSHIRISRDGPPSLAASLLMTVGQLPCGVCPTTSRWMPLAARDWTREGGGGSGMPLLRRCRPSTTDGVPASKGLSPGGLRGRPTGGRTVSKRGRLLASTSRVSCSLVRWLTSAPLSARTDDIGGMTCSQSRVISGNLG